MMRHEPKLKGYKKIAIMGGTFNPIHNGHLVAAEAVREELGIDRVLFIPTGKPPHKSTDPMYNEHRYLMTVLATAENPFFEVSRIELDRDKTSYTIDTVKELLPLCDDDCTLYFITGADAIEQILTWKDPEELLKLCEFVAVTRPGYNKKSLMSKIDNIREKYRGRIRLVEIPALSISSTDIRNRATAAMTIRYLVPDAVEQYIRKFSLYRSEHSRLPAITDINKRLYPLLTPKRFKHTQGVASEAYRLAQRYGLDKEKAYIAGLLHDCAKCYSSEEQLKLCKKYGVKVDKYIKEQPQLAHSFLGEKLAQDLFGVKDEEVLSSIKYHTTGKADMSMFDKVIYIADCIEPFREPYEGLEEIRSLAYKDINKAMICALEHTIEYNEKKGAVIHPLSKEALEFLKNR